MSLKFYPSLMCADFSHLEKEVKALEEAGIDMFHIDIMDGQYVANFAMGVQDIVAVRKATRKPIDVHLMVSNPSLYVNLFISLGVNLIYLHPETVPDLSQVILEIKNQGCQVGLVISLTTDTEVVKEHLKIIDYLLIMTVPAGFSGQTFERRSLDTIKLMTNYRQEEQLAFQLVIDGAVTKEIVAETKALGVNGFVLGTSVLFNQPASYKEIMKELRGEKT